MASLLNMSGSMLLNVATGEIVGDYIPTEKIEIIHNCYISNSSGAQTAYEGWSSSGFIDVENCKHICVSFINQNYAAFYDANKKFIRNAAMNSTKDVPSNAKYFRFSAKTAELADAFAVRIYK